MRVGLIVSLGLRAGIASLVSGCGAYSMPSPTQDGHIMIAADAKGMKAFGDVFNGAITNGKASPDQDTAHWQHRKAEVQADVAVAQAPGFWQKLVGGGAK